jgi:hypothetical protein
MVRDLHSIPLDVQLAMLDMTIVERMLVAPILPVMSVTTIQSSGGQKVSGFVANFHQKSWGFVTSIPRGSSNLPIMVIQKETLNHDIIEMKVNRRRVELVSKWLVAHSPVMLRYRIQFSQENLDSLPEDSMPEFETALVDDIPPIFDPGLAANEESLEEPPTADSPPIPSQANRAAELSDLETSSQEDFVHTFVEGLTVSIEEEEAEAVPQVSWPEIDPRPINEFQVDGLASLAFVVDFPLGDCDPTSKIRNIDVSEKDAVAHLVRYTEVHPVTKKLYYPFLKDPRLIFWLNDRYGTFRINEITDCVDIKL